MISDPKLPFPAEPPAVETPGGRRNGSPLATDLGPPLDSVPVPPTSRTHLWLHRLGVLLFVFLCATVGVMLMILAWRPEWSDNGLLLPYPAIRNLVASGFVRGVVTGLGVLNVWIGFWEAIRYRED